MVMADRDDVATAPGVIAALDTVMLGQQLAAAVLRVPFRKPLAGPANPVVNVAAAVTREAVRSFMGFTSSLPVDEFRSIEQILDRLCSYVMPPVVASYGVTHRVTEIGGVPGILYEPVDATPQALVLYLHGGGYIGTSPRMYAFFTAHLCRETGCAVFVADYRLAPEFPFPAGLDDALAVIDALEGHGIGLERVVVAGDSGGGGLANTLVLRLRERGEVPAGLLLFSPEIDLQLDEPSVTDNAATDILPWNIPTAAYLHGVDPREGIVSAVDADLTGFPPTFVCWGEQEMFRDPIRRYVDRLADAGVPHVGHEEEGMFHVFPILMPWSNPSRRVHRAVDTLVHRHLAPGRAPLDLSVLR